MDGYYPSLDSTKTPPSNTCLACLENCISCVDGTTCALCAKGYKITADKMACAANCDSSCYTCVQNQPLNCLSCYSGYDYDATSQKCIVNIASCNGTGSCPGCPIGYVLGNGYCLTCNVADSNCVNCLASNITACSSCAGGYFLRSTGVC